MRSTGLFGVMLGTAAAAMILGAGSAHADDGVSGPGADARSTIGVERAGAAGSAASDSPGRRAASAGDDRSDESLKEASSGVGERSARPVRLPTTRGKVALAQNDSTRAASVPLRAVASGTRVAPYPSGPDELGDGSADRPLRATTATIRPAPTSRASAPAQPSPPETAVRGFTGNKPGSGVSGTWEFSGVDPALRPLTEAVEHPGVAATQFTRQMVGLATDGAAVTASLVENLAVEIATGFGTSPLWAVPRSLALGVAGIAGEASRTLTGASTGVEVAGEFPVRFGVFDLLGYLTPGATPPGANDPTIDVTTARPLPVILVNGTGMTAAFNWSVGAPVLANAGFKVYTFNYGNPTSLPRFPVQGVTDIATSAQELSEEVDRVLAETGAPKAVLVGYSQGGGILPAYYINVLGGGSKVSQVIGVAPSNHGTDLDYLAYVTLVPIIGPLVSLVVGSFAPGALQQLVTSPFQEVVYGQGDTRPGVLYTNIVSLNDEVLTPYTQQFLAGPSVTNVVIQSRQPNFTGGHGSVLVNPTVWSLVLEALEANPEAVPLPDSSAGALLAA